MERTIFPLVGFLNRSGLLMDVWSSGMVRLVSSQDDDYIELLSMSSNPPGSRTDEELLNDIREGEKIFNKFEKERLNLILKEHYETNL